jgi:hypothetical protein
MKAITFWQGEPPAFQPSLRNVNATGKIVMVYAAAASVSCPAAITRYSQEAFKEVAWTVVGRKVNERGFLAYLYATASQSIGVAVAEDSEAIQMVPV